MLTIKNEAPFNKGLIVIIPDNSLGEFSNEMQ